MIHNQNPIVLQDTLVKKTLREEYNKNKKNIEDF